MFLFPTQESAFFSLLIIFWLGLSVFAHDLTHLVYARLSAYRLRAYYTLLLIQQKLIAWEDLCRFRVLPGCQAQGVVALRSSQSGPTGGGLGDLHQVIGRAAALKSLRDPMHAVGVATITHAIRTLVRKSKTLNDGAV
jgi:hypothetical protein